METALTLFFMVFGLGFYLFVIHIILRDSDTKWERRIMEAREFGFGGKNQHNAKTLHDN